MREQLHIGEVAALVGVSPKTIRYYHEVGLLAEPGRTEAGYRLYTAQDLLRLQRVRRLRALGLPLERIKEILGKPDSEHELALRHALQMLVEELTVPLTTFRVSTLLLAGMILLILKLPLVLAIFALLLLDAVLYVGLRRYSLLRLRGAM